MGAKSGLCIFFSMGVFYHCPTSFTTIGLCCMPTAQKIFFFSIPTATVSILLESLPRFSTLSTVITLAHPATCYMTPESIVSCVSAVVMFGKGLARPAQTQITGMVRNGKCPVDTVPILCIIVPPW